MGDLKERVLALREDLGPWRPVKTSDVFKIPLFKPGEPRALPGVDGLLPDELEDELAAIEKFDAYFQGFVCHDPDGDGEPGWGCPGCDSPTSLPWEWGLANGSGSCGHCGWPVLVYHRKLPGIKMLTAAMPAHPDFVVSGKLGLEPGPLAIKQDKEEAAA